MGRACCVGHIYGWLCALAARVASNRSCRLLHMAVLHLWRSQVKLASVPVGESLKCATWACLCWSQLIPPEGVRNQALSPPLRSAALWVVVALPLVCAAMAHGALRLNRDLLAEELDLIFPSDPS